MLQTHVVVDTPSTAAYTHTVRGDPVGPGDAAGPLPKGSVHGSGFAGSLQVGFWVILVVLAAENTTCPFQHARLPRIPPDPVAGSPAG